MSQAPVSVDAIFKEVLKMEFRPASMRGPLGPRASGSKLYKTDGLFGQSGRTS